MRIETRVPATVDKSTSKKSGEMLSAPRATFSPQTGPQTAFLRTPADICIYGGAAGGGKTVGLILEPLRYVSRVPGFRPTQPQDPASWARSDQADAA
jgi:hypothetical protein